MRLREKQNLIVLPLAAALASAGCSARRPIASASPPFRLGAVYGRPVVFAPSVAESTPNGSVIHVQWEVPPAGASPQKDCVAEDGPFRAESAANHSNSLQIALPSAERWIADIRGVADPEGDAIVALYSTLAKLDQLQQDGCFRGDRFAVRDLILQSLPMEPAEVLFNYYGYRSSRSGMDLKAGMRLKVQRAYLHPAETSEQTHSSDSQEGVSFVYYVVKASSEGKIQFRREGDVRFTPASLKKKFQATGVESELAGLPPQSQYRLVLYGLHVPTDQKLSASIVGASTASRVDELEHELRVHPTLGCKNFGDNPGVACLDFTGWVTVTPQVTIELNGKGKLVDCGTPVRDVVPGDVLNSLAMQRKFMGSYREVHFKPGDENILTLALVDGDRLRWSRATTSGH